MGRMQEELLRKIELSMKLKEMGADPISAITLQDACVEAAKNVNDYISPLCDATVHITIGVLRYVADLLEEQGGLDETGKEMAKKGQGSSSNNFQGTNKNSYKLYHERNKESKMNVSTAVSVLKDNLERYDKQMKMHGIMGGDLLDENPTISAMRKAVEILENIKIVYQKTVIPNELYIDGNIEHVKKGSAIGMADELINYIEFKDRYILELDQKEIVGKLMIIDMRKGAENE